MLPAMPVMVMVTSAGAPEGEGGMEVGGDPYPPPPQAMALTPSARPNATGRTIV
jgi:hypothetical protein